MKLAKYLSPRGIAVLDRGMIRLSPPSSFNDPFEGLPQFRHDIIHSGPVRQGRLILNAELDFEVIAAQLQASRQEELSRFGVFCLSEKTDDLLMWAHYGAAHTGVVVEFDASHPFFRGYEPELVGGVRKMRYSDQRPAPTDGAESLLYRKAKSWEYEQEWRLVRSLSEASLVEQIDGETHYLFELPVESIVRVICGYRMTSDTRQRLAEVLVRPEFSGVRTEHATPDLANYRLLIRREIGYASKPILRTDLRVSFLRFQSGGFRSLDGSTVLPGHPTGKFQQLAGVKLLPAVAGKSNAPESASVKLLPAVAGKSEGPPKGRE